ncbi:ECF transporter S component, partial [candidate division KSB1 bacterium]|nr:ECF transporter S component [candidate division KSB1 bacterium]
MSRLSNTIAHTGLYTAACVVIGLILTPLPNIELITLFVFLGGYIYGIKQGVIIGTTGGFLFSALNPWGSGLAFPPLIVSQVIGFGLAGLTGALIYKTTHTLSEGKLKAAFLQGGERESTDPGFHPGSLLADDGGGSLSLSGSGGEDAAVTIGLNLANANTWTALQSFSNASSTLFSVFGTAYFGGTATSTFDSAGNLTLAGTLTVGGDSINEFAGTGLTVTGNALTADLGTSITSSEITDDTIVNADI